MTNANEQGAGTGVAEAGQVLAYWNALGPAGWYKGGPQIDDEIRARFEPLWRRARAGQLTGWEATAEGALALVLVLDQFPRNIFRDQAESFATDSAALTVATRAISAGQDMAIAPPLRQFFYLPLMHAEDIQAQTHCVVLFDERMPGDNQRHARAHRDVIARFGRFPWRNAALGRHSTAEEIAFQQAGGYAAALASHPAIAGSGEVV